MTGNSISRLYWENIREEVRTVNKVLFDIIEQISPDKTFPLYKMRYTYGETIINKGSFQLPLNAKSQMTSQDISSDLGYCAIPLTLLLNKDSEVFTETNSRIIPLQYLYPGQFFGLFETLSPYPYHPDDPKPIWSVSAGVRSIFMLPKISDVTRHNRIKREFRITELAPKKILDHWAIFSKFANHSIFTERRWYADVLIFSSHWIKKYENDLGWVKFRNYLLELAWLESQVLREKSTLGYLWESISSETITGYKTTPFYLDTLQHLIFIALGARPGFRCIFKKESAAPTDIIEEVYNNIYGLDNYAPLMMGSDRYISNSHHEPIYYSFNYPTLLHSSVEMNKPKRIITGMREIKRLIDSMERKIKSNNTSINAILKKIKFILYHPEKDHMYEEIEESKNILKNDQRIVEAMKHYQRKEFSTMAIFFRGCTSIFSDR